ncbi:iron chaperone [Agromyces sp. SYSU T0242]|uniref:iron chaperone n=1 Tax=Agromyces litoreus TaxID=3158561 RepID=UPI00339461AD
MGEVADYVEGLDEPTRSVIAGIVRTARDAVPEAEEGVSYGMPALRYRDRPLLAVVQARTHVGLYPFSPAVIDAVADALDGFERSKGAIRLSAERPLPGETVRRIVVLRRDEIDAASGRRRG